MPKKKLKKLTGADGKSSHYDRYQWLLYIGALCLVSGIAFQIINQRFNPTASKLSRNNNSASQTVSNDSIIDYEKYITLAKKQKWKPVDPIEKFESTLFRYTTVFDLIEQHQDFDHNQYLKVINQEQSFLIEVFKVSTNRSIDLTSLFMQSITIANDCMYRLSKFYLAQKQQRIVTKTMLMEVESTWIFGAMVSLLKLLSIKSNASMYPHIIIDLNRIDNATHQDASSKAVQLRLYPLISILLSFGANHFHEAMHHAVVNGDDVALTILLKLHPIVGDHPTVAHSADEIMEALNSLKLLELATFAEGLGFIQLSHRLRTEYNSLISSESMQSTNGHLLQLVKAENVSDVINSFYPSRGGIHISEQHLRRKDTTVDGLDFIDLNISIIDSPIASTGSSLSFEPPPPPLCPSSSTQRSCHPIPRLKLSTLHVEDFINQYLRRNLPFLIDMEDAVSETSNDVWDLSNLLELFGDVEIASEFIPYSSLFGMQQNHSALRDFVINGANSMRNHTEKLRQRIAMLQSEPLAEGKDPVQTFSLIDLLAFNMANSTGLDLVTASTVLHFVACTTDTTGLIDAIPWYLFGGKDTKITKRLEKHIFDVVNRTGGGILLQLITATATSSHERSNHSKLSKKSVLPSEWKSQVYLGAALSGAPFHHHGPAFNWLMHGRKHWTLSPPGRDIYSTVHPVEWFIAGGIRSKYNPYQELLLPKDNCLSDDIHFDAPCVVEQQAGEVLYVPRHWSHQTLNLAESIGFAIEISNYIY